MDSSENYFSLPQEKEEHLVLHFQKIEHYFREKERLLTDNQHVPLEEVLSNAPRHYPLIRVLEQVYSFISKDSDWLTKFVDKNGIDFDLKAYLRWKSGKESIKTHYDETKSPSLWIHVLQDYFIELLKSLQILLTMEVYVDPEDFKAFLKKNPKIDHKRRINFVEPSPPSENLPLLFSIVDYLLAVAIKHDLITNMLVDTTLCFDVYRHIDKTDVFKLLKRKEFYIRYYLEYLRHTSPSERIPLPYESDMIVICEDFLENIFDLRFTYSEYKKRLIEKLERVRHKTR